MVADTTICQTTMTAAVQLSGSSFCSAFSAAETMALASSAAMAVDVTTTAAATTAVSG